ncbi:MAG: hypothetical protein AAGD01_20495 [Acidobacteriota bacterium]
MPRTPRFVPEGGALVEISCRTIQGRLLLRPTRLLRQIVVGILARALARWSDVQLHAAVFLPNHYHLLITVPDARTMAAFMGFVNGLLSRKLGPLVGWSGPLWAKRYSHVPVTDEAKSQIARLRYLLAHGVKEGLVLTPADWPGFHCASALTASDGRMQGTWTDATRACRDRARGRKNKPETYDKSVELQLTPLPCWIHLSWDEIARRVQDLIEQITAEGKAQHKKVVGAERLQRQNPNRRIAKPRRGPLPWCHAVSRTSRQAFIEARSLFLAAYHEAAAKWRKGDLDASFPLGCFRPPAPFVAAT